jgi:hypothetical protein
MCPATSSFFKLSMTLRWAQPVPSAFREGRATRPRDRAIHALVDPLIDGGDSGGREALGPVIPCAQDPKSDVACLFAVRVFCTQVVRLVVLTAPAVRFDLIRIARLLLPMARTIHLAEKFRELSQILRPIEVALCQRSDGRMLRCQHQVKHAGNSKGGWADGPSVTVLPHRN